MKTICVIFTVLIWPSFSNINAQTPTVQRASGQLYADNAGGYRFNAPAGWVLQSQQGGWTFMRSGRQTILSVSPHSYNSIDAILNDVFDQQDASSNTHLQARKERYGSNGVLASFTGTLRGQPVVLTTLTLLAPTGGGVTVTTFAPRAEHSTELTQTVRSVAASVSFNKPTTSPLAQQWQQRLSGRQLLYFYTASGFSEKQSYDLCANGQFAYSTDASATSSGFGDQFSAATQDGNSGSWRVAAEGNQAVLILNYRDGRVARLSLAANSGGSGLLINGKRFLTQASPRCR